MELWEYPLVEAWLDHAWSIVAAPTLDGTTADEPDDLSDMVLAGHLGIEWRGGGLLCIVDGDGTAAAVDADGAAAELWLRLVQATEVWRSGPRSEAADVAWVQEVAAVHDVALGDGVWAVDPWMRRFWDLAGLLPDQIGWIGETVHLGAPGRASSEHAVRALIAAIRPGLVLATSPWVVDELSVLAPDVPAIAFDLVTGTSVRGRPGLAFNAWALPASTLVR